MKAVRTAKRQGRRLRPTPHRRSTVLPRFDRGSLFRRQTSHNIECAPSTGDIDKTLSELFAFACVRASFFAPRQGTTSDDSGRETKTDWGGQGLQRATSAHPKRATRRRHVLCNGAATRAKIADYARHRRPGAEAGASLATTRVASAGPDPQVVGRRFGRAEIPFRFPKRFSKKCFLAVRQRGMVFTCQLLDIMSEDCARERYMYMKFNPITIYYMGIFFNPAVVMENFGLRF